MSPFETLVIAVALAMDAFAVSVVAGVSLKRVSRRQTLRLAWHFGLFQGLMPLIGWWAGLLARGAIEAWDHWVAFGLLAFIGTRMLIGGLRADEEKLRDRLDPTRGWPLVVLSLATSIDALAVGLSLAMLRVSAWGPALVIGLVAAAFTGLGLHLGACFGRRLRITGYSEVLGGLLLLLVGLRVLRDHGAV